ncbi:CDP-alcohol phosphatidyltransferase family protein [Thermoproteota archaeon]
MTIFSAWNKTQSANLITLSRILGVVFIFWITPYTTNVMLIWAIVIYTLICSTDFLDGWIARKLDIITDIGKVLDPLADKIVVLVFLPLLEMQVISSFPVFIILVREFAIMGLRVVSAKQGTVVAAKLSGKIKTALTLPVCGILLARVKVIEVVDLKWYLQPLNELRKWIFLWPEWVISVLIWTTVLVTVWSFFDYFWQFIWEYYLRQAGGDSKKATLILKAFIPNIITILNLFCGFIAAGTAWFGFFHVAVLLVLTGTLLDALDGKLARKLDVATRFGANLDTSADFVNFGIAPAVVIFRMLSATPKPWFQMFGIILALIYYFSVQFRLKRFKGRGHTPYFQGLPCPAGAGLVVIAAISNYLSNWQIFAGIVLLVSIFMISKLPYPHMDIASKKTFMRFLKIPMILFAVLTFLKLLHIPIAHHLFVYEVLFGLCFLYVLSPITALLKKR